MTEIQMAKLFDNEEDFLEFDGIVQNPRYKTRRPDLYAFRLLDDLLPGRGADIIAGAEHDEIFLDVDTKELAKVITPDQVRDLVRCGVRYDTETDGLAMFA